MEALPLTDNESIQLDTIRDNYNYVFNRAAKIPPEQMYDWMDFDELDFDRRLTILTAFVINTVELI